MGVDYASEWRVTGSEVCVGKTDLVACKEASAALPGGEGQMCSIWGQERAVGWESQI